MEKETKFCSICMKSVTFNKVVREEEVEVRGVSVHVCLTYLIDPEGHEIYDYDVESSNSEIVDVAYRKKVGLLTAQEIKAIRSKYNLSAELFAKALGMGLKSITRFENGSIQSRETNNLLLLVQEDSNFLKVLNTNKAKLTKKEYQRCLDGCAKQAYAFYTHNMPFPIKLAYKKIKGHPSSLSWSINQSDLFQNAQLSR